MIVQMRTQPGGWHLGPRIISLVLALTLGAVVGCKTSTTAEPTPRIGKGAHEYQHLTEESLEAIQEMLVLLDHVSAQTNGCSSRLVRSFSHEVEQLQVNSIKVRARAQAIQARGTAYFEAWSEHPRDAGKMALYLPEMEEAFAKVKQTTQEAGSCFRPFLSGLRRLRVQLERDPGIIKSPDVKELMQRTREYGSQAVQKLVALRAEIQAVIPVLTRAKAAEKS